MRVALSLMPLFALSVVAQANPTEDQEPILRCLVGSGMVAGSKDPAVAEAGVMATHYWMGRLDPSLNEAEIERRISDMSGRVSMADVQRDLPKCGGEVRARGEMMQRIGRKIRQSAAKP